MRTQVLIVGAGPTGLALALWLARLGVRVRIVDRDAGPGETSRAFAVQARTLELYDQLGLAERLEHGGRPLAALNVHDQRKAIARIPLGDFGRGLSPFPFILILQQDRHEKLLLAPLAEAGVEVERDTELIDVADDGEKVRARLKTPTGADEFCEADFLCGCDGVHSTVRELIGSQFSGGTYPRTFYVADAIARGAMADGEVHYAFAGADLCRVFPLAGEGRVRLIGRVSRAAETSGAQANFSDVASQVFDATGLEIDAVEWFSNYLVHHRIATRFRKGRVFLLGDACHTHSPAGSQGINTGVGDAVNLAWKLSAALGSPAAEALLDTYETERMGVARAVVRTTDLAFGMQVDPGGLMRAVRLALARLAPGVMRLAPARELFFRIVSQLAVGYRGGPLSAGRAGRIAGGDRLPWVSHGDQADNFQPLHTPVWQAHVYGEARADLRRACTARSLPLHVFTWTPAARRQGLAKDALYLIRPDGYVGLASPNQDCEPLLRYMERFGL
jgi:2-polyprenyl-6-methoxyphenol hydroxylase-like FAD-dependent oxidoreductase